MPLEEDDPLVAWTQPEILRPHRRRIIPPEPKRTGRPRADLGPDVTSANPPDRIEDPQLWAVYDEILALDSTGVRTGYAIREALDQVYNGRQTGRWDYMQLWKTEKTHLGTLVEIWMQREFKFDDGDKLDYHIAGSEVDCKWSKDLYSWEIPPEMYNDGEQIALLLWANDYTCRWASGLIRISESVLQPPNSQRDSKRKINSHGRTRILWIKPGADLVVNTLLHIGDRRKLDLITKAAFGQTAVTNLFRELTGVLVNRATVETAAQQIDSQKRVRDARKALRKEGIVIFGHYAPHPELAAELGLPVPDLGRFVSTRVALWTPGDPEGFVVVNGQRWRRARAGEAGGLAPVLPRQGVESD